MTPLQRGFALAVSLACCRAQQPAAAARSVLLTTSFRASASYEQAIERLDRYYQDQTGRKGAEVLPEIGPRRHYEVWHDMWVFFDPAGDQTMVTLKRQSESVTTRVVKGWMLEIAGRLDGDLPLTFREEPPLRLIEREVYASRKDIVAALAAQAALRPLASWRHAGLFVSAAPLTSVVLAPVGLRGVHHLTVSAEDAAVGNQTVARVVRATAGPRICAAFSEMAGLEAEIQKAAQDKRDEISIRAVGLVTNAQLDLQVIEQQIRDTPEMRKRIAAAPGVYGVLCRVDRAYRKIVVSLFQAQRVLAQVSVPNVRQPAGPGALLTVRVRTRPLAPGAYRVRLDGESLAGESSRIDERTYWFDGKTFEEP